MDEAYRLIPEDPGRDFGRESLETLMESIEGGNETTTDRPAYIFAGYTEEMERMIAANAGFKRRITNTFHFDDYSSQELTKILRNMAMKAGHTIHVSDKTINRKFAELDKKALSQLNAGVCDQLLSQAINSINWRSYNMISKNSGNIKLNTLTMLRIDDINKAFSNVKENLTNVKP